MQTNSSVPEPIVKGTHTPAPWRVGEVTEVVHDYPERYTSGSVSVFGQGGASIATVYGGHKHPTYRAYVPLEERDANARLIAAAPQLLDALRLADDYLHDSRMRAEEYDTMRDLIARAIAKAEGR